MTELKSGALNEQKGIIWHYFRCGKNIENDYKSRIALAKYNVCEY